MLTVHRPPLGINLPWLLGPANLGKRISDSGMRLAQKASGPDALLPTGPCQAPAGGGEEEGRRPRTGREAL